MISITSLPHAESLRIFQEWCDEEADCHGFGTTLCSCHGSAELAKAATNDQLVFAAHHNSSEVIGMITAILLRQRKIRKIHQDTKIRVVLAQLYVVPAFRRRGIAQALVLHLLGTAVREHSATLWNISSSIR